MNKFNLYSQVWLRYQALWDLNPDTLYGKLGTNLQVWMATLEEIKLVLMNNFLLLIFT